MKPTVVSMLAMLLAPLAAIPLASARTVHTAGLLQAVSTVAAPDNGPVPAAVPSSATSSEPAVPGPLAPGSAAETPVPRTAVTMVPATTIPVTSGASGVMFGPMAAPNGAGMPPVPPQMGEAMQRHMVEFQRLAAEQQAFRRTMLGALTRAHLAALGRIVGELAVAPNPDPRRAAAQLDAMLSPAEAQSVVRVEREKNAAALHEFERIAAQSGMPRQPLAPSVGSNRNTITMTASFDNDAGVILLRNAALGLMTPRMNFLQQRLP